MTNGAPLPGPRPAAPLQHGPDEVRTVVSGIVAQLDSLPAEQLATQEAVQLFEDAHSVLVKALASVDTV
ncbi:hypothetical protein [Hoyosella subflava]|uniref:hypothetical protein n=1 Tax=Hoyosella subflava TaxID=639313 RepID=UPI00059BB5E5|nr:hypothetical protein [Hoyosella subflava]